jgi:hypothetical protein
MNGQKKVIVRKVVRVGGWQLFKRGAKMLPFGGTLVVATLVGSDIRRKGVVKGLVNSGLDAMPFVGLMKNGIELFRGDFISDKPATAAKLKIERGSYEQNGKRS